MRFQIAKGTKKREIQTPFGICASREDFESLARQIRGRVSEDPDWTFGIITIQTDDFEFGPAGQMAEPWE